MWWLKTMLTEKQPPYSYLLTPYQWNDSIIHREHGERIGKRSHVDLEAGVKGDNVLVPIPAVNRGRSDVQNIFGVAVIKTSNDQLKSPMKVGLLHRHYSRKQFNLCPQCLLSMEDVCTDKSVSCKSCVMQIFLCCQHFIK